MLSVAMLNVIIHGVVGCFISDYYGAFHFIFCYK